jgi:hypothetical protein
VPGAFLPRQALGSEGDATGFMVVLGLAFFEGPSLAVAGE